MKDHPNEMVVFGGDLNITLDEDSETGFFSKEMSSVGLVSHLVGCKTCDGTHNYKSRWSFLDVLIFSKNLEDKGTAPYELAPDTIDVVKYTENHLYKGNSPKRFTDNGEGVSDHFPIYARLKLRDSATVETK